MPFAAKIFSTRVGVITSKTLWNDRQTDHVIGMDHVDRSGSPAARVRSPPPAEGRAALAGIRKTPHFQFKGTMMTDPSDLMRRAAELTDRADHEESIEVRDRLLRMAAHYVQIAESEEWLAAHPISIGSVTGLLVSSTPGKAEDDDG
jgi:hypothetical protein